jgi:hypothetical protein
MKREKASHRNWTALNTTLAWAMFGSPLAYEKGLSAKPDGTEVGRRLFSRSKRAC